MPGRRTDVDQDLLADYPERTEERDAVLLGRDGRGALKYFDPRDEVVATATEDDDGTLDVDWSAAEPLGERSLAKVLDDVGRKVGWDALSEYARDRMDEE